MPLACGAPFGAGKRYQLNAAELPGYTVTLLMESTVDGAGKVETGVIVAYIGEPYSTEMPEMRSGMFMPSANAPAVPP